MPNCWNSGSPRVSLQDPQWRNHRSISLTRLGVQMVLPQQCWPAEQVSVRPTPPFPSPSPTPQALLARPAGSCNADAQCSGLDSLPDALLTDILRRSLASMGAALLPWLRLSLVCRCGSLAGLPAIRWGRTCASTERLCWHQYVLHHARRARCYEYPPIRMLQPAGAHVERHIGASGSLSRSRQCASTQVG